MLSASAIVGFIGCRQACVRSSLRVIDSMYWQWWFANYQQSVAYVWRQIVCYSLIQILFMHRLILILHLPMQFFDVYVYTLLLLLNVVVIGNRTMPIVDELAESNTSMYVYVGGYVCICYASRYSAHWPHEATTVLIRRTVLLALSWSLRWRSSQKPFY